MAHTASLAPKEARTKCVAAPKPLLQAKLDVGPARDRYEIEADRIADRIMANGVTAPQGAPPVISRMPQPSAQRAATGTGMAVSNQRPIPPRAEEVRTRKVEDDEKVNAVAVQRSGNGPVAAPAAAETSIARMRSAGGTPLAQPLKGQMESGFGHSLSSVRVHSNQAAHKAAQVIGARAFTVGTNIFFGAGRYQPDTTAGQRLLAHELVHTEQQKGLGDAAQTMPIQRDIDEDDGDLEEDLPPTSYRASNSVGRVETDAVPAPAGNPTSAAPAIGIPRIRMFIPAISIPTVQGAPKGTRDRNRARFPSGVAEQVPNAPDQSIRAEGPFTFVQQTIRPQGSNEGATALWTTAAGPRSTQTLSCINNWDVNAGNPILNAQNNSVHYLRLASDRRSRASSLIITGTASELIGHRLLTIPPWSQTGNYVESGMQVDHAHELQLGGAHVVDNLWLLAGTPNASAGSTIMHAFQRRVERLLSAAPSGFWSNLGITPAPTVETVKRHPAITVDFARITGSRIQMQTANAFWTMTQIQQGDHLPHLREMTEQEVASEGLLLRSQRPSTVSIFAHRNGGFRRRFRTNANNEVSPFNRSDGFFRGFNYTGSIVDRDIFASIQAGQISPQNFPDGAPIITGLEGTIFGSSSDPAGRRRRISSFSTADTNPPYWTVHGASHFGFGGYVETSDFRHLMSQARVAIHGASPITFEDAGVSADGAIWADGTITAAKALFPGLEIPILIRGTDIFVQFPIPTDRLNFGPVSVTEAFLSLGVGDHGIFAEGSAGLAIDQVGSGQVTARVQDGNTILSGEFNFDIDFIDPARATITYNLGEDTLTLSLTAGVPSGALPGVESGEVTATVSRDNIVIDGSLNLGGVMRGTVVSVGYSPTEGLELGADNVPLPVEHLPGVSSAMASLHARLNPETGEWSFGGAGRADLAIAGATGGIVVTVDGDKVMFGGMLAVSKGPASGSLSFTATNTPMDDEGNITEGEAEDSYTVFGRGGAEITFGRILKGSAEITLSPDASIQIEGTIGLPPNFEVFAKQEYNKSLLTVETPDFPIWGVSLGGVGFGIFAFADAELSFNAFIGPGELRDTQVTALMDLDAPEDATITGSARFFVPAGAGLMLDIGGGLRARVAVAFAEGRVGLDGELGIEADASAGVIVDWNRNDGLSVEADVEANARPKFRVGVNARVRAGVDLRLTEITKTWGPWRRNLGEFGPDMEMGVKVPVKWNESDGLDFSLEDIEVRQPRIEPKEILKSAFEELV